MIGAGGSQQIRALLAWCKRLSFKSRVRAHIFRLANVCRLKSLTFSYTIFYGFECIHWRIRVRCMAMVYERMNIFHNLVCQLWMCSVRHRNITDCHANFCHFMSFFSLTPKAVPCALVVGACKCAPLLTAVKRQQIHISIYEFLYRKLNSKSQWEMQRDGKWAVLKLV